MTDFKVEPRLCLATAVADGGDGVAAAHAVADIAQQALVVGIEGQEAAAVVEVAPSGGPRRIVSRSRLAASSTCPGLASRDNLSIYGASYEWFDQFLILY